MAPFWGHPFAPYFDVHQGYRVLTHSHFEKSFEQEACRGRLVQILICFRSVAPILSSQTGRIGVYVTFL